MTQSEAVLAVPHRFGDKRGYDLAVVDRLAAVQDYLDALNRAIEQSSLSSMRRRGLYKC